MLVQINFAVKGDYIPSDHNYALYANIIQFNSDLRNLDWQLGTINGIKDYNGLIKLGTKSRWFIRTDYGNIALFTGINKMTLGKWQVETSVESVTTIAIPTNMATRLLTIKGHETEQSLFEKIQDLVRHIPVIGERKTIKIQRFSIVGYSVSFFNLDQEKAQTLMLTGLGGKRKMGCGVFCKVL